MLGRFANRLCWINGLTKQWKPWVQNRVVKIRNTTSKLNHVPGNLNAADIPTRQISTHDLNADGVSLNGPSLLYSEEERWPNVPVDERMLLDDVELELRSQVVTNVSVVERKIDLSEIIDPDKFSKLNTLISVTAYVLRFTNNLLNRIRNKDVTRGEITASEFKAAEKLWVLHEQSVAISCSKFDCWRKSLGLFCDEEGLIRCRGRLGQSMLEYDRKFPLFLNNESYFTKLLIWRCHFGLKHAGLASTLNRLRCKFWIVRGRQAVKKVL